MRTRHSLGLGSFVLSFALLPIGAVFVLAGCGKGGANSGAPNENGAGASAGNTSGSGGNASSPGGSNNGAGAESSTGAAMGTGGEDNTGTGGAGSEPGPEPPDTCEPSVTLADTSTPTVVIGTGTADSCNETDLRNAAEQGGTITFNCGPDPVTIDLTEQIELPNDMETIIDGNNLVTLDAGKLTRHFYFYHPDFMNGVGRVVLQRMVLKNGKAPAGEFFPQNEAMPECAYGYKEGSGGVIYMRNGNLVVIDCRFLDNEAALIGPDVGGGAIYAVGSPSVIISGSQFIGNTASNGGAVGMLFANPEIYNSVFENNTAVGIGQNTAGHAGCPEFGHIGQGGAGGNSGAMYFDGLNDEDHVYTICGSTFRENKSNELAGALFRTPNAGTRNMLIDRCTFDGNTANAGGVSFIKDNNLTVRDSLFVNNRSGVNVVGEESFAVLGGLWVNTGTVDVVNSTFSNNQPTSLDAEGSGTVKNATFENTKVDSGVEYDNSLFVDVECDDTATGANNVQWPSATACAGGTTFADPALGALADNGGSTETMLPGTAAAVDDVGVDCPTTDQRGEPRDTASCAAGAVEP
jgi:hypothetical protein